MIWLKLLLGALTMFCFLCAGGRLSEGYEDDFFFWLGLGIFGMALVGAL